MKSMLMPYQEESGAVRATRVVTRLIGARFCWQVEGYLELAEYILKLNVFADAAGFEPATNRLTAGCSAN